MHYLNNDFYDSPLDYDLYQFIPLSAPDIKVDFLWKLSPFTPDFSLPGILQLKIFDSFVGAFLLDNRCLNFFHLNHLTKEKGTGYIHILEKLVGFNYYSFDIFCVLCFHAFYLFILFTAFSVIFSPVN